MTDPSLSRVETASKAEEELATRQEQVDRREEKASAVEERLRVWGEDLRRWEAELEVRERRVEFLARVFCPTRGGGEQGRAQRTLPVRVGAQVQALPRPAWSVAGRLPR